MKDLVAHLLADDLGLLSRGRDGHADAQLAAGEPLVAFLDRRNGEWVATTRRLSSRVLRDLLEWSGPQTAEWFASLDPYAIGPRVSWAGPDPAPMWLGVARELTERWHHGEQIREAVGAASADDPALFHPVLSTFAFALPVTFAGAAATDGTAVVLTIEGAAGGTWSLVRDVTGWKLYVGAAEEPVASVTLGQDDAWRMYTRVLSPDELERRARIRGDESLGRRLLGATGIIA